MNDVATEALLAIIQEEWLKISEKRRHWAVWIREYAPIIDTENPYHWRALPERVWILESQGVREENVWKWHRYLSIHSQFPSVNDRFGCVGMGLAAFAAYAGTDDEYYFEYQWDDRWGHGWHATINAAGQVDIDRDLWIS